MTPSSGTFGPMAFSNRQVAPSEVVAADDLDYELLPRRALTVDMVTVVVVLVFAALAAGGLLFVLDVNLRWLVPIGGALVVLGTVSEALTVLAFRRRGWALREHDISYRRGVISQVTVSVPFRRIQHATVKQSFVERAVGLATLEIFTAGGVGTDLALKGIEQHTADRLRDHVLAVDL